MINNVSLTGRLTKDPEIRFTPSGVPVANFTLAVNRSFTNDKGEREADFLKCVAWRTTAETVADHLKKGNLIGVTGRVETRNFEGEDGKMIYVTEIVVDRFSFLESKENKEEKKPYRKYEGKK